MGLLCQRRLKSSFHPAPTYLRKDAADSSFPEQVELIEAAYARPELRRLYAYTSHWTLRFSTVISTTLDGLPKTEDGEVSINTITLTALGKGKFSVQASLLGSVIAEVHTAEAAVSYAMRYVHPDLGPAVFSSTR